MLQESKIIRISETWEIGVQKANGSKPLTTPSQWLSNTLIASSLKESGKIILETSTQRGQQAPSSEERIGSLTHR